MLNRMEAFLEVAKTKSITKAADNLFTSQPSISMKIKALEEELGTKLFDRTKKAVALTEEGELFRQYADSIVHLYKEATLMVNDFNSLNRGTLSISAGTYYGSYILPNMLGYFKSKYPNINMRIKVIKTENVVEDIMLNKYELGFISEIDLVKKYSNLVCLPLFEDEQILVCSPTHPFSSLKRIDLSLCTGETFIIPDRGTALRQLLDDCFQQLEIQLEDPVILNGLEPIKRTVENNLGISVLPVQSVEREIELGFLVGIPFNNFELKRTIFAIYRQDKILSKAAIEFLQVVENYHQET